MLALQRPSSIFVESWRTISVLANGVLEGIRPGWQAATATHSAVQAMKFFITQLIDALRTGKPTASGKNK